jgi:EAL domain-containing protein (putative c-di-GMP-specific phosphodiesterase class I)
MILALAKTLKLKVVAEGVETQQQYQFLKEKGCDIIQGYYFSRLLPSKKIVEFIKENKKI